MMFEEIVSQKNEKGGSMEKNFIQSNNRESPYWGAKWVPERVHMSGDFAYAS